MGVLVWVFREPGIAVQVVVARTTVLISEIAGEAEG